MHVYLHVPFCARRCSYCDFAIAVRREVPSDAYAAAILREWALWQLHPAWQDSPEIQTIYFGGGTPSRISPEAITRLLGHIDHERRIQPDAEITLEANPDDVNREAAAAWRAAGVNRISLGVQSFNPRVLGWMHRVHTVDQIFRAVEAIRGAGISNLSVDLIFGLPAAQRRDWADDLEQAFSLAPEHVSLYGLTVERSTPLSRWTARGEVTAIDEESYAAEFLAAHAALLDHGYEHYEVSNAARPGRRARHNSAYWRRAPFIGLGPSAHSGFGRERCWNVREWAQYERLVSSGKSPMEGREVLDDSAVQLEELYLGLRTADGVTSPRVPDRVRGEWQGQGWALPGKDEIRLSAEGWLRLDGLVASISSERSPSNEPGFTLPHRTPPLDSGHARPA
jgi:oxygen-independent coproporphyrinogen-3 oxidase